MSGSVFHIESPNVVLLAFKPSDDGDPNHYRLRLQEACQTIGASVLPITLAEVTDMTERNDISQAGIPI